MKGKFKGFKVCLKFFNKEYLLRSNIVSEVKVMLGFIPHSGLSLLFGVCMEPDTILVTQFVAINQDGVDNFGWALM